MGSADHPRSLAPEPKKHWPKQHDDSFRLEDYPDWYIPSKNGSWGMVRSPDSPSLQLSSALLPPLPAHSQGTQSPTTRTKGRGQLFDEGATSCFVRHVWYGGFCVAENFVYRSFRVLFNKDVNALFNLAYNIYQQRITYFGGEIERDS